MRVRLEGAPTTRPNSATPLGSLLLGQRQARRQVPRLVDICPPSALAGSLVSSLFSGPNSSALSPPRFARCCYVITSYGLRLAIDARPTYCGLAGAATRADLFSSLTLSEASRLSEPSNLMAL